MTRQEKENLMFKLYGENSIIMGKNRLKAFEKFIEEYRKIFPVNTHPDGFITKCIFCYGDLIINKFTGTTFCYGCRQELPFELLRKEGDNE